jgi:hypothetical protein
MPYLGDYLGQLLSEITMARMQADLEAVRVAEIYAGHPLLRHMPVPHFRLPDVEMDVPVVIKQMEERRLEEGSRGAPLAKDLRSSFDTVLETQLQRNNISLSPQQRKKLKSELDFQISMLEQPSEVAVDVNRIADKLSKSASQILSEVVRPGESSETQRISKLETELKNAARVEFLKLRKTPPRLHALVTTAEIREAGPSETITHLRLKISEQAVEWTTIESEGQKQDRLVPE